ncbi:FAD-dependent oxidoreductase, partial [bacterium]|nr:FAD-dependent oxidoreductase [bacterium]
LHRLLNHAQEVGVVCEFWDRDKVVAEEPHVEAVAGAFFPGTGILDSHAFMKALENQALAKKVSLLYNHSVLSVEKDPRGWLLTLQNGDEQLEILAGSVINAAGLGAAQLANLAAGGQRYEHRFCRGRYFAVRGRQNAFSRLIYPVPQKDGLGVHVTLDLAGQVRLGPDTDWCGESNPASLERHYQCDWESLRPTFEVAARKYFPSLKGAEMDPGLVGIRPKLFIDGKAHPDFYLRSSRDWVDCLGIESPGLTASLALAERVAGLLGES